MLRCDNFLKDLIFEMHSFFSRLSRQRKALKQFFFKLKEQPDEYLGHHAFTTNNNFNSIFTNYSQNLYAFHPIISPAFENVHLTIVF